MPYLNVDEVESALVMVSSPPNDSFIQLIPLPHKTWEKRRVHAIKIGSGTGPERIGVYFLGGVHAREWGSPDILIFFIEQLAQAYRTNSGVTLGNNAFTAAQIQSIVNTLDIFVLPQANPDGRHFSMTADAMWRKNRRPAPSGRKGHHNCVGVDINRNYDFLWNYPAYFNAEAPIANSTDPCDYQVYIGPAAASEPETQNVVYLMESFPQIRFFIDIHSYGEDILYSWGDDDDQSADPAMNFQNPAYNGLRGLADDPTYQEYIDAGDKQLSIDLANGMRDAIQVVRGRAYTVEQALSLYPTAGTSDDYGYSRHIVDSSKSKIVSFVVEWGSPQNPTPFHPNYREMQQIIQEITAGLIKFCLDIIARQALPTS
jgi:carboxypeptidase T